MGSVDPIDGEREGLAEDRTERPRRAEAGVDLVDKALGERELLFEGPGAEHRATDREATLEEASELNRPLHPAEETEADEAAPIGERAEVLFEVSSPDEVDDEVNAT